MQSEHCSMLIDNTLAGIEGILSHKVELNNNRAVVDIDPAKTSLEKIAGTIRSLGYNVVSVKKNYPVTGLSCASCAVSAGEYAQGSAWSN